MAVFFSSEEGGFEQLVIIGYTTISKMNAIPTAMSFPDFTCLYIWGKEDVEGGGVCSSLSSAFPVSAEVSHAGAPTHTQG